MILLFGSNLALYSEQIPHDEKILKMMLRVHAACGAESSKWANVAIKILNICVEMFCHHPCFPWLFCMCCIYPPSGAKTWDKFKILKIF